MLACHNILLSTALQTAGIHKTDKFVLNMTIGKLVADLVNSFTMNSAYIKTHVFLPFSTTLEYIAKAFFSYLAMFFRSRALIYQVLLTS